MPTIPTSSRPSSDIHRVRAALKALHDVAADRVDLNDGPAWDAIAEAHSAWLWSTPEDAPPTAPVQAPRAAGDLREALEVEIAAIERQVKITCDLDRNETAAKKADPVATTVEISLSHVLDAVLRIRALASALAAPSSDRGDATDGWLPIGDRPEAGKKIIALYNDGSGARMLWIYDGGMIDSDGDDCGAWPLDGCDRWVYLPDRLEFHCETWAENPVVLTLPAPPTPRPESSR